jgi:hypothetical protein
MPRLIKVRQFAMTAHLDPARLGDRGRAVRSASGRPLRPRRTSRTSPRTPASSASRRASSRDASAPTWARPPPTVRARASAQEEAGIRPQPPAPPSIQNNSDLSQGSARHSGAGWHKVGGELEMRRGGRRAHCGIPIQNGSPRCLPSHLVTVPSKR